MAQKCRFFAGWRGFGRGLLPSLLGVAPEKAIKLGVCSSPHLVLGGRVLHRRSGHSRDSTARLHGGACQVNDWALDMLCGGDRHQETGRGGPGCHSWLRVDWHP